MTLTDRIRRVTTTCERCGTTLTIGELPAHRRLETCHPSWNYRLPEKFQDPALSDLTSRPSSEIPDRANFPAGPADGENTLVPADYRTVLSQLREAALRAPSDPGDDA